jgi:hypothetical protein
MLKTDQDHPFYKPLWRRIAIVACTLGWVAFEVIYGSSGLWLALAAGACAYCLWTFLITFPKES